jgi:ribosomal protein L11 methyltransferase
VNSIVTQKWFSVTADINFENKDFIRYCYQYLIGTYDHNQNRIYYFNKEDSEEILKIIDKKKIKHKLLFKEVEYENWHKSYEKYFMPIKIKDELIIIPKWHKVKDNSLKTIKILPGMAFGTGNHETTQLIIASIIKNISKNDRVLDLGAGSGILGIAALMYGASSVLSIENDIDCEGNFFENLELNNISKNCNLLIKDALSIKDYNYDVVSANINTGVIIKLLPKIKKYRSNKSKIILSGLLISDSPKIISLLNNLNFNIVEKTQKGEWICIVID